MSIFHVIDALKHFRVGQRITVKPGQRAYVVSAVFDGQVWCDEVSSAPKTCDSCQWWDRDTKASGYAGRTESRYCRAALPVATVTGCDGPIGTWPVTRPLDWCAHHKEAA